MAAWMAQKMSTVFAAAKCSGGERERESLQQLGKNEFMDSALFRI